MPTPLTSGSRSIPNRWLHGSATVLWIGDSLSQDIETRVFQGLRVTPAGLLIRGSSYSGLAGLTWVNVGQGGLGAAGLLAERNYSPFPTAEAVFTGTAVPVTGAPPTGNSRFLTNSGETLLQPGRENYAFAGLDWLVGPHANPTARVVLYRNADAVSGAVVRNTIRGASNTVFRGLGNWLTAPAPTAPAYYADEFPFTAPAAGEGLNPEAQSFEGAVPTAGDNFVICCALYRTGDPGFTFVPASVGGSSITQWLDPTFIADAAFNGVLPLLNLTDVVIALGQNNTAGQTAAQYQASLLQLVARVRSAAPGVSITFLPLYDTNQPGLNNAPHLAGFADAMYAAQQQTPDSCFLNLYAAGGTWTQNNPVGLFSDGLHPSAAGAVYFTRVIGDLLELLASGDDLTTAAGRYATQADLEDAFGADNVRQWSAQSASPTAPTDVPRVQRALDFADATIDDFFRHGPYAVPLLPVASAATVTRWATTFAAAWLYRSRAASTTTGSDAPATISVPPGSTVSATVASAAADPYAAMVTTVEQEMAHAKSGATKLDAPPSTPTFTDAPAVVA